MIKQFTETFLNKLAVAVINFIIVAFTANQLGINIRGEISLFITNLTILMLLSNLIGGSAIAYYSNKIKSSSLLFISVSGALAVNLAGFIFFSLTHYPFALHLFFLGLLAGFFTSLQSLHIGKNNIRLYNYSLLSQPLFLLAGILSLYYTNNLHDVHNYLYALYAAYIISIMISVIISGSTFSLLKNGTKNIQWKEIIRFSSTAGVSNIIQFFNYRLNFYFLFYLFGNASVGLVSVAVAIAEGVWIIGSSLSVNLYARLLNEPDEKQKHVLTKKAFRISLWATLSAVIVLLLLPDVFYTSVFGDEFYRIKSLLVILSPGIIFIGSSNMIGNYFSAAGELKVNNIKSVIGLISTIVFSLFLIKPLGEEGACLTYSISYLFIFSWYLYQYHKRDRLKLADLVLKKSDLNN